MSKLSVERVSGVYLMMCGAFGVWLGMLGFGAGLFFWDFWRGIGLGFLLAGLGSPLAAFFGGKRVMKAITKACAELMQERSQNDGD